MHDSMPYDPIQSQGQGHGASDIPKIALFKGLSRLPFTMGAGKRSRPSVLHGTNFD